MINYHYRTLSEDSIMPVVSRYSQEQQDQLVQKLMDLLIAEQVPRDLALMSLGNLVTLIIQQQESTEKRKALAEQFGTILKTTVS